MLGGKYVFFDGRLDTLTGHARRHGLKLSTVSMRLKRIGGGPRQLKEVFAERHLGRPFDVSILTHDLDVDAGRMGIPAKTIASRMRRGMTYEQAFAAGARCEIMGSRTIAYKGEVHSMSGWARKLGLTPQAIHARLKSGASVAQALAKGRWVVRPKTGIRSVHATSRRSRELAELGIIL